MEWESYIGNFIMRDISQKRKLFKLKIFGEYNAQIRRVDVHYFSSDTYYGTFSKELSERDLLPYEFVVDTDKWWWKHLRSITYLNDTKKEVKIGNKQYPVWKISCDEFSDDQYFVTKRSRYPLLD